MTPLIDGPGPRPRRGALAALAYGALAIGISELAAIGVLDSLGEDLAVSASSAGWIVTAYAIGVCVGGPVLAMRLAGRDPRRVLIAALSIFVTCSVLLAVLPQFWMLLLSRVVAGAAHGLYVGVATAHAAGLSSAQHRGRAVAMVFGGIAVATVVGAPIGALAGSWYGWRAAFWLVAIASAVALVAVVVVVPSGTVPQVRRRVSVARRLARPQLLAALCLIIPLMGAVFTFYTFVTTFLAERTGLAVAPVSTLLLVFGVASAAGTVIGGRLADRFGTRALIMTSSVVVASLATLSVAGTLAAPTTLALAACGLAAFAFIPAYQLRVLALAGDGADVASTLGAAAANAGIVVGSLVGGQVLALASSAWLPPVAAGLSAVALLSVVVSTATGRRTGAKRAEPSLHGPRR